MKSIDFSFQSWYLDTIRAECLHVAVVDERDSVQVDDAEVWCGRFEFMDIYDFVDFFFFFTDVFVGS